MAPYTDKMTDLASLSLEDLKALETEVTAAFEAADSGDDLDAMSAAADDLDAVRSAIKTAEGGEAEAEPSEDVVPEVAAPEAVAAGGELPPEFLANKKGEDEDEDEDKKEDEDEEIVASAESESDQPTEGDSTDDSDAVTASADSNKEDAVNELPEDRLPVRTEPRTTITAGADIPGTQHGTAFTSERAVAEAFSKRLQSFAGVRGGNGEQVIVASVAVDPGPERTLDERDPSGNLEKIQKVTALETITASGG